MSPDNPGARSVVSADVDTNKKDALVKTAHQRSKPYDSVTQSDLLREAVDEWLSNHWDELPEEAKDDLDEDQVANAGGEEEVSEA
jgi:hypothetical protein